MIPVYIEIGTKRVFADAISWPGWCRSARTEGEALATLLAYGKRYAKATASSDVRFVPPASVDEFEVPIVPLWLRPIRPVAKPSTCFVHAHTARSRPPARVGRGPSGVRDSTSAMRRGTH
ncbi:MAG TPA: hypothetical protein VNL92_07640 [Dehalococcoidia bacterium]|nr:hypothetical protein [Dehalococcoidia bacterium]